MNFLISHQYTEDHLIVITILLSTNKYFFYGVKKHTNAAK